MDYHKLRELVGYADAEAKLERAFQCYKVQLAKGMREGHSLPFDEKDVPALASSSAWFKNRYGYYTPSALEKVSHYCVLRRARASARDRYSDKELSYMDIDNSIYHLRAAHMGMIIANRLKSILPKGVISGLKNSLKRNIKTK